MLGTMEDKGVTNFQLLLLKVQRVFELKFLATLTEACIALYY